MKQWALMCLTARLPPGAITEIEEHEFLEAAEEEYSKWDDIGNEEVQTFIKKIGENWLVDVEWPPERGSAKIRIKKRGHCLRLVRAAFPGHGTNTMELPCLLEEGHEGECVPQKLNHPPDGIYDNRIKKRSELWRDGKCVAWAAVQAVAEKTNPDHPHNQPDRPA